MRISQEFYCGECQGYFQVRLNMALNFEVHVKCPKCGHEHRRVIRDGLILETGRYASDIQEIILATMATYSKTPVTETMQKAKRWGDRRDGVPSIPSCKIGGLKKPPTMEEDCEHC